MDKVNALCLILQVSVTVAWQLFRARSHYISEQSISAFANLLCINVTF